MAGHARGAGLKERRDAGGGSEGHWEDIAGDSAVVPIGVHNVMLYAMHCRKRCDGPAPLKGMATGAEAMAACCAAPGNHTLMSARLTFFFFFQAEDGIRDA